MTNGTDYPACGHGAVALVPALGCAACLSNQRDVARQEAAAAEEQRDLARARCEELRRLIVQLADDLGDDPRHAWADEALAEADAPDFGEPLLARLRAVEHDHIINLDIAREATERRDDALRDYADARAIASDLYAASITCKRLRAALEVLLDVYGGAHSHVDDCDRSPCPEHDMWRLVEEALR